MNPKSLLRGLFTRLFRANAVFDEMGIPDSTLIVANHVSFLDGLLLAALAPQCWTYGVDTEFSRGRGLSARFLRWLHRSRVGVVVPMDAAHPVGLRHLARALKRGETVVLFPQGEIVSEHVPVHFQPGVQLLERHSRAILAVHIAGAGQSLYGRTPGSVTLLPALTLQVRWVASTADAQAWLEACRTGRPEEPAKRSAVSIYA